MTDQPPKKDFIAPMAEIVAAYLSRNILPVAEIPQLMKTIYDSIAGLASNDALSAPTLQEPAVPVKKSVVPDYIICLEDGKKMKMLKRYLKTAYGMTPEQYRKKWNLPADYPMVAPNYAERRSSLAKEHGFGTTDRGEKD